MQTHRLPQAPDADARYFAVGASREDRTESRAGGVNVFIVKAVDEPLDAVGEGR